MAQYEGSYLGGAQIGGEIESGPGGWAKGLIYFASAMLVIVGVFHALAGLTALLDDSFYQVRSAYALEANVTTWGWVHLIGGVVFVVAGFYLLSGNLFARIIAVFAAMVSAVASFWSIPYYPVWNMLILALDVAVIWAVVAHGHQLKPAE
jgi:hypothetical protein